MDASDGSSADSEHAPASVPWQTTARSLARLDARVPRGWEVLRARFPPILDGDGARGLLALLLAVTSWLGAGFREHVAATPLDPLAIGMRLLATGLSLRALILLLELARRLRIALRARHSVLVLAPEGLYLTDGVTERALEKPSIVSIVLAGSWQTRPTGRRWADVFVVGSSRDSLYLAIPPLFEHGPGVLSERLMRWLGVIPEDESTPLPPPAPLASQVYDDAARGIVEPGTLVVPHGRGWLRRGPYAAILLAIVIADGLARTSTELPLEAWLLTSAAIGLALVVPLAWWVAMRREILVRKGIAMILTPAELLLRTRQGVHRAPWGKLQRVSIDERRAFSAIDGFHAAKTLVIKRKDDPPIRYEEAFLGLPAEVAQALLDAYRTRSLPLPHERRAVASAADQPAQLAEPSPEGGIEDTPDRPREPGDGAGEANTPSEA